MFDFFVALRNSIFKNRLFRKFLAVLKIFLKFKYIVFFEFVFILIF